MSIKGTQTEKNILTAFCGESQARNRYTYFSAKAKKEGFVQISAIFEETAGQESQHAKLEFKLLEGGEAEISAAFPAGVIGNTLENLKAAAAGEHFETNEMYPGFADVADKEGFGVAAAFKNLYAPSPNIIPAFLPLAQAIFIKLHKPSNTLCLTSA